MSGALFLDDCKVKSGDLPQRVQTRLLAKLLHIFEEDSRKSTPPEKKKTNITQPLADRPRGFMRTLLPARSATCLYNCLLIAVIWP